MPKKTSPETAIKRVVRQWLGLKGWFVFPILQTLGAYRGISDFVALKQGIVYFIEVKTPTGKLSHYQTDFMDQINAHGGRYLIVRSIDDLEIMEGI